MKRNNNTQQIQELICQHVDMARRVARGMSLRVPHSKRDELESAALLGLTEAAQRYDTSRNEPFGAFAIRRVRGAVLDELRRSDVMSRRARSLSRQVERTASSMAGQLGRVPSNDEIATNLGVKSDDVANARDNSVRMVPYDTATGRSMSHTEDHVERISRRRRLDAVHQAMHKLPDRQRDVIAMYYDSGLKMREIGERLGVTESRVSQMRASAVFAIKRALHAHKRAANDELNIKSVDAAIRPSRKRATGRTA